MPHPIPGTPHHELICDYHWGERGSLTMAWGCMAPCLLRVEETLYANTLCEPRWFFWRRRGEGGWERGADGPMLRPPLTLAGPDGTLSVIAGGVVWRGEVPGDFERLQPLCGMPHECRMMIYMGAAINQAGDILVAFVNRFQERELMAAVLPAGSTDWQVRSIGLLDVRYCYPQVQFVGNTAHVFVVEDERVDAADAKWGMGRGYFYRFRELRYFHTDDVLGGNWSCTQVWKQDDGFVHTADIQLLPDGEVNLLWWGYDRSDHGRPAEGAVHSLHHSVAASPGVGFTHHPVCVGQVQPGTFLADGAGGWHYLYANCRETPDHPLLGHPVAKGDLVYRHRGATGELGEPQVVAVPKGAEPSTPRLVRPHRYGGQALADELEFWWEDAWNPDGGTTTHRLAWYGRLPLGG